MDKFAENIKNLLSACTPYAWLLPVINCGVKPTRLRVG